MTFVIDKETNKWTNSKIPLLGDIARIKAFTIEQPKNIDPNHLVNATVTMDKEVTYNGKELTANVEVKINDKLLIEGEDYDVEYSNNVDASSNARIIIKAKQNSEYTGTKKEKFVISKDKNTLTTLILENEELKVSAKYGNPIIEYFSDENCSNKINFNPNVEGVHYARAKSDETENYTSEYSNVVRFIVNKNTDIDHKPEVKPD